MRGTHWHSTGEVTAVLQNAGFADLEYVQTLTGHPRYTDDEVEKPSPGYKTGDFIVVRGKKP
jgi:hypothetical protein